MLNVARVLLTMAAVQYGIVPGLVDLTATHVFHPEWPPHARFHMVWLLSIGSGTALWTMIVTWWPMPQRALHLRYAAVAGGVVLAGFFVSLAAISTYGGSLSDLDQPIRVLGLDGNLLSFSLAAIFQVTAAGVLWRLPDPVMAAGSGAGSGADSGSGSGGDTI